MIVNMPFFRRIPGTDSIASAAAGLSSRLAWRALLLRDPRRYTATRSELANLDSPVVQELYDEAARLPLRRRLRLISRRGKTHIAQELLRRRLRRAPDGARYFALDGRRIFFDLAESDPDDDETLVRGVLNILHEAFFEEQEFLRHGMELRDGDVVFDLGGNVGTSALFFSDAVGPRGAVYSFEPVFAEALGRTIRESGADNVRPVPLAVGDEPGHVPFSLHSLGIDSRLATEDDRDSVRVVEMTTLDDFVENEGVERLDLIKMDIEGAEEGAIEGARETLARFRPRLTIASYHTDPEGRPQHPRLVGLLRELHYEVREEGDRRIYAW